jgi:hypothetical protein
MFGLAASQIGQADDPEMFEFAARRHDRRFDLPIAVGSHHERFTLRRERFR